MASRDSGTPSMEVHVPGEGKIAPTQETPPQSQQGLAAESAVPRIVITEASPMNPVEPSPSVAESAIVNIPAEKSSAEKPASVPEDATTALPDQIQQDSNDDFHPAQECVVSIPEIVQEPVAGNPEVDSSEEGSASDHEQDDLRPSPRCCHAYGGFEGFYYRIYDAFERSWYPLPLWIILLAVPLSAGFIGAKYMEECPVRQALPYVIFFLGVSGFVTLMLKICSLSAASIFAEVQSNAREAVGQGYYAMLTMSFMLFISESVIFFATEHRAAGKTVNCHPTFFVYTRCLNWAIIGFLILIILLKVPSCFIRRRYTVA